ncbi:acetylornithine aminotransferase ArgD [Clostridium aceticum]|uniref:Acetylornithine aminotransferase ArgD n=1 Tax=Clostridium aceticum TaxID=84022 RepID=A0A0D8IDI7_9CLOT|nr:acetylornithine transaminase [Clostridium aceticum]AKL94414.1 acetylornithine aminotransferase ArgD [Clostridium aceticum]KJF28360.1 acetylornithine aminotransferase [Clostridium aceticum]
MKKDWITLDQKYVLPTYGRMSIVVKKGEGMYITDEEDHTYLDLFSGLAVNVLGHCHPLLLEELKNQSNQFGHISNFFYNKPAIELAEKLVEATFPGKIYFANSGAESTEAAIKYIHKYGQENNRQGIVVFKNSFHGRTLGALKLTRMEKVQQDFPTPGFPVHEFEKEDLQQLEEVFKKHQPAALLFEPVFGSGGLQVISVEFIEGARALCDQYNVLLCMDEIQTGMGRTGELFAYQYSNVTPDVLLFAKGVGGGLPLGGILVAEKLAHYFKEGDHGTTFAPSPIASALGKKTMEILQEGILAQSKEVGNYLKTELERLKDQYPEIIGEIRGKGLMLGAVILKNHEILKGKFIEKNILVNMTNVNILRLLPSLIIEKQHVDTFIESFEEIIKEW